MAMKWAAPHAFAALAFMAAFMGAGPEEGREAATHSREGCGALRPMFEILFDLITGFVKASNNSNIRNCIIMPLVILLAFNGVRD